MKAMTPVQSSPVRPARSAAAHTSRAARRAGQGTARPAGRGTSPSSWIPRAAGAGLAAALVIAGGTLLYGRIAQVQRGAVLPDIPPGVQRDPATKVRGAVISISGEASNPAASYDPASGTVTVRFQSRYYDPKHSAALNRQYLATEGRLIVQLALYHDASAQQVVAQLYHGRQYLATVTGAPGQDYAAYAVQYAPDLPR
jgi:hypothetical protein